MAEARSHVVMYDVLSGTNDYTLELVRALRPHVDLTLVTLENSRIPADWVTRHLPLMPAYGSRAPLLQRVRRILDTYRAIVRECLAVPGSVFHLQFLRFAPLELLLMLWLKCRGVPVLMTAHNVLPHEPKFWHPTLYGLIYRLADGVQVLSQSVREGLLARFPRSLRPAKLRVVPHGPYLRARAGAPVAEAQLARVLLGLPAELFYVLQFGAMRPYKGLEQAIDAMALIDEGQPTRCNLLGGAEPGYVADLQARIDAGPARRNTVLSPGYASEEQLALHLVAADLVLFPYVNISQSGALLHALTFEKPVLCNDLPGFREFLPDGGRDFVLNTGEAVAFAAAIGKLRDEPAYRAQQAMRIANFLRSDLSWDRIGLQMSDFYADLTQGGAGRQEGRAEA